jgi:toxin ParE1/3/4
MMQIDYAPEAVSKLAAIKKKIKEEYGENAALRILKKMTASIRNLQRFENIGVELCKLLDVQTDYRYIYTEKNYVIYRIEEDTIKIINILNEKQDFMQILFGIMTISNEIEDYWEE